MEFSGSIDVNDQQSPLHTVMTVMTTHHPLRWISICCLLVYSTGCAGGAGARLETRISPASWSLWPRVNATKVANSEALKDPFLPEPNTSVGSKAAKSVLEKQASESGLSVESLVLFEAEFRDASPMERAEWMEHLKSVPADMIPHILSARRLALQRDAQLANQEKPSSASDSTDLIATRSAYDQRFNDVSPWTSPKSQDTPASSTAETRDQMAPVGLGALESMPTTQDRQIQTTSYDKSVNAPSPLEQKYLKTLPQALDRASLPHDPASLSAENRLAANPISDLPRIHSRDALSQPVMTSEISAMRPNTAEMSTTSQSRGPWEYELHKLISMAEAQAASLSPGTTETEKQAYVAAQVHLRMLYLMSHQEVRSLQSIEGIDAADQEFWQQMFWAMSNYFDQKGMPAEADRISQTITQLSSAIDRIDDKANLELRNVSFSHKIDGFGNFKRYERDEFKAGQPVLIYAELRNFKSVPTPEGAFQTAVKSRVEIYKAGPNGGLISTQEFPASEDVSSSLRHDYYHSYLINLPENLTLGPHILKLTLEDQQSQKIATYSLRFGIN